MTMWTSQVALFALLLSIVVVTVTDGFSWPVPVDRQLTNNAELISPNGIIGQNSIGQTTASSNSQTSTTNAGNVKTVTATANHNQGGLASSFGSLAAEERMVIDTYITAIINHTYVDEMGETVKLSGENNAKFGEGRVFMAAGKLVHVTSAQNLADHTACHWDIRGTRGAKLPVGEPWIALIKRGKCNFEDKVKHAYAKQAIGVIVYNDKDSLSLDKMKINDKERNITAVFTYKRIGEQLAKLLDNNYELLTTITPGAEVTKQYQNMNRTSVLFVSISFIILMIISLVWLIFYYVQRFRYLQSKDKQSRRMCNVAKRIIAKIPTKSVKADDKEYENECCPICIELYKMNDLIRVLPCKHEYHKSCIDPWLLDHRTCPMCKMDILKHYGFVVGVVRQSNHIQSSPIRSARDIIINDTHRVAASNSAPDGSSGFNQYQGGSRNNSNTNNNIIIDNSNSSGVGPAGSASRVGDMVSPSAASNDIIVNERNSGRGRPVPCGNIVSTGDAAVADTGDNVSDSPTIIIDATSRDGCNSNMGNGCWESRPVNGSDGSNRRLASDDVAHIQMDNV